MKPIKAWLDILENCFLTFIESFSRYHRCLCRTVRVVGSHRDGNCRLPVPSTETDRRGDRLPRRHQRSQRTPCPSCCCCSSSVCRPDLRRFRSSRFTYLKWYNLEIFTIINSPVTLLFNTLYNQMISKLRSNIKIVMLLV